MIYKYLYQDKENRNCEGDIKARDRTAAYALLRKQGIRPYRLIGDDPWNWRPWAIAAGYALLLGVIIVLVILLGARMTGEAAANPATASAASGESAIPPAADSGLEAEARREAEAYVNNAPEAYRLDVWRSVNARLAERGLAPLPPPLQ